MSNRVEFEVVGDNKNIKKALDETKEGIRSTAKEAEKAGEDIDSVFKKIGTAAAAIGLGFSATQLVKDIARVRGEFQQLEIAFGTLLGSEEKASDLFGQLVNTAAKTPFDLQGVAGGAKQLLAFGFEAEKVNETIIRLGDIAAGLSLPLNDLVYLYGTTMTQGQVFTQDFRQFQSRGIPLADELAKQFGVAKNEVADLVSAGKVGFPEVEKAIISMTSAGGKFGGLMEKQSASITGQISNLEDAWDGMLNDIGKSTQGIISNSLSAATYMVENYKKIGQAIALIVAAYGSYKAAQIAVIAYKKVEAKVTGLVTAAKLGDTAATTGMAAAETVAATKTAMLTAATKKLVLALKAKAVAMINNPYVLTAMAVTALAAGIYKVVTAKSAEEKAIDNVNKERQKSKELREEEKQTIESLLATIGDETQTTSAQIQAYNELKNLLPELTEQRSLEELQMMSNVEIQKAYNQELEKANYAEAVKNAEVYRKKLEELDAEEKAVGNKPITSQAQYVQVQTRLKLINQEKLEYQQRLKNTENFIEEQDRLFEEANKKPEAFYGTEYEKAKKQWEDADKALQDALKNKDNYTVEQYKELVKNEKTTADAFKALGGSTSRSKTGTGTNAKNADKDAAKNEERAGELLLDIVRQNQRNRIELEEEGDALLLAQIEQDYKDRTEEIEKQEKELMSLQGGKLTEEQQAAFAEGRDIATKKRDKETKDVKENRAKQDKAQLEAMLENYLTYEQEREKIQKEYAEKRKRMQEAGVGQENIDILNQEEEEALATADEVFAKKSSTYRTWLNEITQMTLEQLEQALTQAEDALSKLNQEGASEKDKAIARAQIGALKGKIQNVREQGSLKPEKRATQEWRDFAESLEESASAFDELGNQLGGIAGEILSSVGSVASSTVSMINNIVQLVEISAQGAQQTATTAARAIKAVETASVILAIISAAVQIIRKIVELATKMHDGKYDAVIEANQKKVDKLEKSYEKLEEAVDNAFGKKAVQTLKQMNDNLAQQNGLIRAQAEAEAEKKKAEEDTIQSYNEKIEENQKQIAENQKAMEEAIFGNDIKSAIEDFADAYADAVQDNMNLNESAAEQAKKAMRDMVQESIKEYVAGTGRMEKIRQKMKALYADGVFSEEDQKLIKAEYDRLNKELDAKFGWAEDILSDTESSSSESSTGRGIATASQESVDENNGRLMSIQVSMDGITAQMVSVVNNLANMTRVSADSNSILSDIRSLHVQSNGFLEDLVKYTKPLNDNIISVVEQLKKL